MTRKLIGHVGVDSGQILVCDPCYIASEWEEHDDTLCPPSIYRDIKSKKTYACSLHSGHEDADVQFDNYESPIKECGNKTPNELLEEGRWTKEPVPKSKDFRGEFSYRGCCHSIMLNDPPAGQLRYRLGHDGAGVATEAGYGDGSYPVYAELNDEGRVMKIIVDFG